MSVEISARLNEEELVHMICRYLAWKRHAPHYVHTPASYIDFMAFCSGMIKDLAIGEETHRTIKWGTYKFYKHDAAQFIEAFKDEFDTGSFRRGYET